jgi:long-chain acyl-CoA synthetase
MTRTLSTSPSGLFLHEIVLAACRQYPAKTAVVDSSCSPARRISYGEYGEMIEAAARGMAAAGLKPGEMVALYLPNSWEFCVAYHAATLAGAVPTPLNPSYREREVRHQLQSSGAVLLITDGPLVRDKDLSGLPALRRLYTTRGRASGDEPFGDLLRGSSQAWPQWADDPARRLAALPFSSGTTGLPKGVMLTHENLVANVFQHLAVEDPVTAADVVLGSLPLYHIYGLTVALNSVLSLGATLVLLPRFSSAAAIDLLNREGVSIMPVVPPMLNSFCQASEAGEFPGDHPVRWVQSGGAPLAADLARRFTSLTGIPVRQGYGMTEASPETHAGVTAGPLYRPESIGFPLALTECRILDERGNEVGVGEAGELVVRGPQVMRGYWRDAEATAAVLQDGWLWSGDIVRRDAEGFYYVLDRRKEMIKYKGFAVAPAEIESVLLEHPAISDCGVVPRPDAACGEVPCAFVVLRPGIAPSQQLKSELAAWTASQLTTYKQPHEIHFVAEIPHTPSGKILRRELRSRVGGAEAGV